MELGGGIRRDIGLGKLIETHTRDHPYIPTHRERKRERERGGRVLPLNIGSTIQTAVGPKLENCPKISSR